MYQFYAALPSEASQYQPIHAHVLGFYHLIAQAVVGRVNNQVIVLTSTIVYLFSLRLFPRVCSRSNICLKLHVAMPLQSLLIDWLSMKPLEYFISYVTSISCLLARMITMPNTRCVGFVGDIRILSPFCSFYLITASSKLAIPTFAF